MRWLIKAVTGMFSILALIGCSSGSANNGRLQVSETAAEPPYVINETIRMNNCGGKADSEQTAERSRTVTVEGGGEFEIGYEIIKGAVSAKYSELAGASKSQKLIAPPGTNMEFVLAWSEQSWIGIITSQGKPGQATYRVSVPVAVELISSRDLGCSSAAPAPTQKQSVQSTSVVVQPTEIIRVTQPPSYNIQHEDYLQQTLDENVLANSLVCLTTGPIVVQNTLTPVQFYGNGRATAICWIGPQRAQAYNLAGSSLKHVTIANGDPEEVAISLVQLWGQEMMTRSDGCGASYGPCKSADLAVIRSDGSVIQP
jgi:hypothetical protein